MEKRTFHTVHDVLRFAIDEEQCAIRHYTQKAQLTTQYELKILWEQLARDEMRHKAILTNFLEQNLIINKEVNLEIDLLPGLEKIENEASEVDKIYTYAINSEESAYKIYLDLADLTEDAEIKRLILIIASEESAHRDNLIHDMQYIPS